MRAEAACGTHRHRDGVKHGGAALGVRLGRALLPCFSDYLLGLSVPRVAPSFSPGCLALTLGPYHDEGTDKKSHSGGLWGGH